MAGSAAEARAEFVKVYRYTYAVFYGADHINDGTALGYGPGNDREHATFWLERDFGTDARFGAGVEWTRQGEGRIGDFWDPADSQSQNAGASLSGVVEKTVFPHARAELRWRDVLTLRARVGAALVDNPGHVPGEDTSLRGSVETRVQW
ncbi:MAG: hypothetical protein HKN12_12255 [Gemmatimonadetes bacterium]|nr:hypothetical protein [Gemmatimonadota bacterium]